MNRASPADLRKALEVANSLARAGILFVAIPVADSNERDKRIAEGVERLGEMAKQAEVEGGAS